MKKKLAIIGCGGIGSYHLGHFKQYGDIIDLVGFCDLIKERAEGFRAQIGTGEVFTDYVEMLDTVKPEIVFVCIPPYCHGDVERNLIKRGIHFFVEKPVALDMTLAMEIRDAIKENNIITGCGFQCRYSNLVEPNRAFVDNNEIVYVECARMGGIPGTDWWADKKLSGGQIVEQTVHQFDIIRYMMGEPETVFTMNAKGFVKNGPANYDTDDLTTTVVKFKSGVLASISTGCYVTGGNAFDSKVTFSTKDKRADLRILDKFEIYGEQPPKPEEKKEGGFVISNDGGVASASGDSVIYRQDGDAGIHCDRTFIEAVISGDGSKVRSPYEDAVKTLAFVLACNKSIDTGLPVNVDDMYK